MQLGSAPFVISLVQGMVPGLVAGYLERGLDPLATPRGRGLEVADEVVAVLPPLGKITQEPPSCEELRGLDIIIAVDERHGANLRERKVRVDCLCELCCCVMTPPGMRRRRMRGMRRDGCRR